MFPGTHAQEAPDRVAVVLAGSGEQRTYAELDENSRRLARAFYDAGLRRGDVVAMLSDNDVRAYEIYWAAMRSGLYLTAVNHHLTVDEAAYIVADCGARVLVAAAAKGELAAGVRARVPALELAIAFGGPVEGFVDYDATLAGAAAAPLPSQPRGADLLYSSGTTGRPKGIKPALPDRQVDEPGDGLIAVFGARYGFGPETVYLSPAPIYHAAPLRFAATVQAMGGTVVLMERFEPRAALAAIERFGVTHSQWVPTMFVRMLKLPAADRAAHDLSTHRCAVHAAAPCPVAVKRAMIDWWGPILEEYYAATESNGIAMVSSTEWLAHPGTVGQAGLGTLRICADDGTLLPPGEVGTVYFERDVVPFSYHGDEAKTRAAQHPLHPTWTTTGDLGHLDADGWLYLSDRKAFLIISGGVNIYPQEIEDVLITHPAVLDVAVIGIPDEEMGEAVHALVLPMPGVAGDEALGAALIAFARDRLAHFKAPRSLAFVDELPRTPTGKLAKGGLTAAHRERAASAG